VVEIKIKKIITKIMKKVYEKGVGYRITENINLKIKMK
jgi:hypothetical protein